MDTEEQNANNAEALRKLTEQLAEVPEGDLVIQVKTTDRVLYYQLQEI